MTPFLQQAEQVLVFAATQACLQADGKEANLKKFTMKCSDRVKRWTSLMCMVLVCLLVYQAPAYATPAGASWPVAGQTLEEPVIQAEGAVVIDASSGEILYGKNARERFYPASITKLMTALLVMEKCNLDDTVTFSETATANLESGAVSLGLVEGDKLTVRQCLYALLLKSANEVGNGLAEHVSGSVSQFASLMNQKASALGCTGTNFVNPHGLNDSNHYTTPYDMALIARAAFQNQELCRINTTLSYKLPATKKSEARTITMGHKMMYPSDSRYYEGIIGGKTGYTSKAGNTLVTGVERDGVRLVAVVMKSSYTHYTDTKALLDYGFAKMESRGAAPDNSGMSTGIITQIAPGAGPSADTQPSQQAEPGAVTQASQNVGPGVDHQAAQGAGGQTLQNGVSGSQPGQNTQATQQPQAPVTGWVKDTAGWYYIKADGSRAAGEWLELSDGDYWIDSNGYMATGWRLFNNGAWYYFRSSGAMAENHWVLDCGKWFYLGADGAMMKGTITPDGYQLGADGAWIQS